VVYIIIPQSYDTVGAQNFLLWRGPRDALEGLLPGANKKERRRRKHQALPREAAPMS